MSEEACGTLVCDGVPEGVVTVILDHLAFDVRGSGWKGARDLCVGPHFCATVNGGNDNDNSNSHAAASMFPSGFFFYVERPGQVILKQWSPTDECLVDLEEGDDREERERRLISRASSPEYAAKLLRCKDPTFVQVWKGISSHITQETIDRISPVKRVISVLGEPDEGDKLEMLTDHEKRLQEQLRSSESSSSSTRKKTTNRCFYLEIPKRKLDEVAGKKGCLSGRALSDLYLDKSWLVSALGGSEKLLGEMEFSFVAFLSCGSLQGFAQWKSVLELFLEAEDFAEEFGVVMERQLALFKNSNACNTYMIDPEWIEAFFQEIREKLSELNPAAGAAVV